MARTQWSDALVTKAIGEHAAILKRMPTRSEIPNSLSCAIVKRGGFDAWAKRLGLPVKDSETLLGRGIEAVVADELRRRGHLVERQTVKAPFDLLVNGVTRIDVKAGNYGEYPRPTRGDIVCGYVFAGIKRGRDCDVFILVCLRDGAPFAYFVVPAEVADVATITITPSNLSGQGRARWAPYRDRFDLIAEVASDQASPSTSVSSATSVV